MGRNRIRASTAAVVLIFFTSSASYLVTPVLAVRLVDLGVPVASASLLIGIQLFIGRFATPVTGWFSDRYGPKWLIVYGLVLSAFAHFVLGINGSVAWAILSIVLAGLGLALFGPASKALAISSSESEETRSKIFAWRNLCAHSGTAFGAMCGTAIIASPVADYVFWFASTIQFIIALLVIAIVGDCKQEVKGNGVGQSMRLLLSRSGLAKVAPLMMFWATYVQLTATLPLAVDQSVGPEFLGVVFGVNAIVVLVLQIPAEKLLATFTVTPVVRILIGQGFLAASVLLLGIDGANPFIWVAFGAMNGLGVVVAAPSIDTWVTAGVRDGELGQYLSLSFVALGIGALIGGSLGGLAFESSSGAPGYGWPWAVAAVGLTVPVLIPVLTSRKRSNA